MATLGKLFSNLDQDAPPSKVINKPNSVPKNNKLGFFRSSWMLRAKTGMSFVMIDIHVCPKSVVLYT